MRSLASLAAVTSDCSSEVRSEAARARRVGRTAAPSSPDRRMMSATSPSSGTPSSTGELGELLPGGAALEPGAQQRVADVREARPVPDRRGPLQRLDRARVGGSLQRHQLEVHADGAAHLGPGRRRAPAQVDLGQEGHAGGEPDRHGDRKGHGQGEPATGRIEVSSTGNTSPTNP